MALNYQNPYLNTTNNSSQYNTLYSYNTSNTQTSATSNTQVNNLTTNSSSTTNSPAAVYSKSQTYSLLTYNAQGTTNPPSVGYSSNSSISALSTGTTPPTSGNGSTSGTGTTPPTSGGGSSGGSTTGVGTKPPTPPINPTPTTPPTPPTPITPSTAPPTSPLSSEQVSDSLNDLYNLGYIPEVSPGGISPIGMFTGVPDVSSQIGKFQEDHNLTVTGTLNKETYDELQYATVTNNGLNFIANLEVGKGQLVLDSNNKILGVKATNGSTIAYGYDIGQDPLKMEIDKASSVSQNTAFSYLTRVANECSDAITASEDITITLNKCQVDALAALRYNMGSLGGIPDIFDDINNKASYDTFKNDIDAYYADIAKEHPNTAINLPGWNDRTVQILNLYFYGDYGSMPVDAVKGVYNEK